MNYSIGSTSKQIFEEKKIQSNENENEDRTIHLIRNEDREKMFISNRIFFSIIFYFIHLTNIFALENQTSRAVEVCTSNSFCVRGFCDRNRTTPACVCDRGWVYGKDGSETCTYQQKSKLAAFLLSFFVGGFGADWFYLSTGNGGYIAAGVFKFLTLGGLGIWWLVDWIRILTNSFPDGQGIHLLEWTP